MRWAVRVGGVALAMAVAGFVWPTRYAYSTVGQGEATYFVRRDRLTADIQVWNPGRSETALERTYDSTLVCGLFDDLVPGNPCEPLDYSEWREKAEAHQECSARHSDPLDAMICKYGEADKAKLAALRKERAKAEELRRGGWR